MIFEAFERTSSIVLIAQVPALEAPNSSTLAAVLWLLGGLVLLGVGADLMVRGAVALAVRLKLTPTVIGLTVVALGTSLPELMASAMAQFKALATGSNSYQAIAWGNVVGSNVFNIGFVLGLCSTIRPLSVDSSTRRFEYATMLTSALLMLPALAFGGQSNEITRWEACAMLALFTAFTFVAIRRARAHVKSAEEEVGEAAELSKSFGSSLALVVLGCVLLAVGGDLLVDGAVSLALHMGMSYRVVSSIIVACLTGFPELVTSAFAVYRKQTHMAVANIVGSNIFNTWMVLGVGAAILPLDIAEDGLVVDLSFMIGTSLLLGLLLIPKSLRLWQGLTLLTCYAAYVWVLFER